MSRRKLRVGVLFGGKSSEHDVSLVSARSVMAAIDKTRYEVVPIGIERDGHWLRGGDPMAQLTAGEYASPLPAAQLAQDATPPRVDFAFLAGETAVQLVNGASSPMAPQVDIIFPVLHGPMGEDGTVQGLLDLVNIPYVGCGVLASALGMDKLVCKAVFAAQRLPQVPYVGLLRRRWEAEPDAVLAELEAQLPYPMFVKPANMGSSVGISKAHNRLELAAGLHEAARYDRKLVVEQGVDGREIELSVLGNDDDVLVSLPGEVVPGNEFYDYAAKYLLDNSQLLIPAPLTPALTQEAQALARAAYLALDGAGLARVDLLLDRGSERLFINEINTMPGFTSISMYPKLWEASGLAYGALIERLLELALARHADRQRNVTTR